MKTLSPSQAKTEMAKTKDFLNELDTDKRFSNYIAIREIGFIYISMFPIDKEITLGLIYELGTFFSDILFIDKAFFNNLYHFLSIKFNDDLDKSQKDYLTKELDYFIKPRENKTHPDTYKFAAGFLIYNLAYKNDYTSKNEARELAEYIFKLSETDLRNATKSVKSAYKYHSNNAMPFWRIKEQLANFLFFMVLGDILDIQSTSFEELFKQYQSNSSKKTATTQKTFDGYKKFKEKFWADTIPLLTEENEFSKEISEIQGYDYTALLSKSPKDITETEIFKSCCLTNHKAFNKGYTDSL